MYSWTRMFFNVRCWNFRNLLFKPLNELRYVRLRARQAPTSCPTPRGSAALEHFCTFTR